MTALGTKLTRLRKNKGYTQQELADLLGVSQPAYHKWETGDVKPDLESLLKASQVLEVDLSELTEDYNSLIQNSQFKGSNIVGNHQPVINMHSPELMDQLLKNQEQITQILLTQNKLIETFMQNIQKPS